MRVRSGVMEAHGAAGEALGAGKRWRPDGVGHGRTLVLLCCCACKGNALGAGRTVTPGWGVHAAPLRTLRCTLRGLRHHEPSMATSSAPVFGVDCWCAGQANIFLPFLAPQHLNDALSFWLYATCPTTDVDSCYFFDPQVGTPAWQLAGPWYRGGATMEPAPCTAPAPSYGAEARPHGKKGCLFPLHALDRPRLSCFPWLAPGGSLTRVATHGADAKHTGVVHPAENLIGADPELQLH